MRAMEQGWVGIKPRCALVSRKTTEVGRGPRGTEALAAPLAFQQCLPLCAWAQPLLRSPTALKEGSGGHVYCPQHKAQPKAPGLGLELSQAAPSWLWGTRRHLQVMPRSRAPFPRLSPNSGDSPCLRPIPPGSAAGNPRPHPSPPFSAPGFLSPSHCCGAADSPGVMSGAVLRHPTDSGLSRAPSLCLSPQRRSSEAEGCPLNATRGTGLDQCQSATWCAQRSPARPTLWGRRAVGM